MKNIFYYANDKGAFLARTGQDEILSIPLKDAPIFSKPAISFSNDEYYRELLKKTVDARNQMGSVALSMAQLAAGSYDGLIMYPYKKNGLTDICDIAAGYYIMKQSGILVKNYELKDYNYRDPNHGIVALRHENAKKILALIERK